MFRSEKSQLLTQTIGDGLVLDVGGWADPLPRADYVIDCFPYETRGLAYHGIGKLPDTITYPEPKTGERFSKSTWIRHDICSSNPFPFPDKMFDFVICSHTLEDVRDPVRVCEEIVRVGKAGYIETPSCLVELTRNHEGMVGATHHRWLVRMSEDHVSFVMKPHGLHCSRSTWVPFTYTFRRPDSEKVSSIFWRESFEFEELLLGDGSRLAAEFVSAQQIPGYYYLWDHLSIAKNKLRNLFRRTPPSRDALWTWDKLLAIK
jgi:SAM-dependent methyltransferase